MKDVYVKAIERELDGKSKYVNEVDGGRSEQSISVQIENDLVDVIVFCKRVILALRRV